VRIDDDDNLVNLARRYRTDVATLRSVNGLTSNRLRPGQVLLIPHAAPVPEPTEDARRGVARTHQVQPGDSLWAISRAHGVSVAAIAGANGLAVGETLRVGQRLTIPGNATAQTSEASDLQRVRYGVRRGDSLSRIAHRFNVAVADIIAWNRLDVNDYLKPGQDLVIYVGASTE